MHNFDSNTMAKTGKILAELADSDVPLSGDLSMRRTGADPNDAAHFEPAEHRCCRGRGVHPHSGPRLQCCSATELPPLKASEDVVNMLAANRHQNLSGHRGPYSSAGQKDRRRVEGPTTSNPPRLLMACRMSLTVSDDGCRSRCLSHDDKQGETSI